MKLIPEKKISDHAGISLESHLLAGKTVKIRSLADFQKRFTENLQNPHDYAHRVKALGITNEECKQGGGGASCDTWAATYKLPFAHG